MDLLLINQQEQSYFNYRQLPGGCQPQRKVQNCYSCLLCCRTKGERTTQIQPRITEPRVPGTAHEVAFFLGMCAFCRLMCQPLSGYGVAAWYLSIHSSLRSRSCRNGILKYNLLLFLLLFRRRKLLLIRRRNRRRLYFNIPFLQAERERSDE